MEKLRQFFDELEKDNLAKVTTDALSIIKDTVVLEYHPNQESLQCEIELGISDIENLLDVMDSEKFPNDVDALEKVLELLEELQEN